MPKRHLRNKILILEHLLSDPDLQSPFSDLWERIFVLRNLTDGITSNSVVGYVNQLLQLGFIQSSVGTWKFQVGDREQHQFSIHPDLRNKPRLVVGILAALRLETSYSRIDATQLTMLLRSNNHSIRQVISGMIANYPEMKSEIEFGITQYWWSDPKVNPVGENMEAQRIYDFYKRLQQNGQGTIKYLTNLMKANKVHRSTIQKWCYDLMEMGVVCRVEKKVDETLKFYYYHQPVETPGSVDDIAVLLKISEDPLSASEICKITGYSKFAVSTALRALVARYPQIEMSDREHEQPGRNPKVYLWKNSRVHTREERTFLIEDPEDVEVQEVQPMVPEPVIETPVVMAPVEAMQLPDKPFAKMTIRELISHVGISEMPADFLGVLAKETLDLIHTNLVQKLGEKVEVAELIG